MGTARILWSPPGFVVELEHADRAAAHDDAGNERHRGEHEHVAGVAVVGQRLRDVAVVARVVHRRST
jgi:hypothetical protein